MFGKKKMLFGNGGVVITNNTFIGGVSSTINTATLLAAKLSISDTDIQNFTIDGDDIECFIGVDYTINTDGFKENTDLIDYFDNDGKCTEININAFFHATFSDHSISFWFPNVIKIGNGTFTNNRGGLLYYFPRCVNYGGAVTDNNVFFFGNHADAKMYVDPTMETINGGNLEGDLAAAQNTYGAEIIFVDNFTASDAIDDLAVDTVYATGVKLDWTAPSSTNTIDFYEIYSDGVLQSTTTDLFGFAFGVNLETYNYTVKVVDEFFNKSDFSNEVTQTLNGTDPVDSSDANAYWRLNTNSDDFVNAHDGTDTSIVYSDGEYATFNGTTSVSSVDDSDSFSFVTGTTDEPFSISLRVKFGLTNNNGFLITKEDGSNREWGLLQSGNNNINFRIWKEGGTSARIGINVALTIVLGQSYHIVVTYDGSETEAGIKMYIDKVLKSSTSDSSGTYTNMNNTSSKVYIGKFPTVTTFTHNGGINGMGVWNVELIQSEIDFMEEKQKLGFELF